MIGGVALVVLRQWLRSAKQLLRIGLWDNCGSMAAAILGHKFRFANQMLGIGLRRNREYFRRRVDQTHNSRWLVDD